MWQTIANFAITRTLIETVPQYHLDAYWDRKVLLRGFDLDRHEITTGETMRLMFYWQTKTVLEPEYELRVELINGDGQTAATITPLCGLVPPHQWYTHRTSGPAFTITADPDTPPGEYTLWGGLQHMGTSDYLPLVDGTPQLSLGTITVAGP